MTKLNVECASSASDPPPTHFDCPRQMPRSARYVACGTNPDTSSDSYYISTNRSRSHWILWCAWTDWDEGCIERCAVAWCERGGQGERQAAYELLRAWCGLCLADYEQPPEVDQDGGMLTPEEVRRLVTEVTEEHDSNS